MDPKKTRGERRFMRIADSDIYKNETIETQKSAIESFRNVLRSRWWRLNNLYYVIDENGDKVKFKFRKVQEKLYRERWYFNVVLKSRQHGITTFICILFLDACLFGKNVFADIIAHTQKDAQKFLVNKIKFAYTNLPKAIRNAVTCVVDSKSELSFSNGSSLYVSTSARSQTLSFLHISELGKISLADPGKADEIIHGSIPALHPGSVIFIESTADGGGDGPFHDICKRAEDKQLSNEELTKLDFKFHFFPWHEDPSNRLESDNIVINERMKIYFAMLNDDYSIVIDDAQKNWYIVTEQTHGIQMRIQHPSYPGEAFQSAIESSYYREQFRKIREDKRICSVPHQKGTLVTTCWDLGMDDSMAIWFYQIVGRELHFIDCYDNVGYGFDHYKDILNERSEKFGYRYGVHLAPHDIAVREIGTGGMTRMMSAAEIGLCFRRVPKTKNLMADIDNVRNLMSICWFDQSKCEKGLKMLEGYRREWNKNKQIFQDYPAKTEHRHFADAFRTGMIGHKMELDQKSRNKDIQVKKTSNYSYV